MTAHFVNLLEDLKRRSLRMASLVEDILSESIDAVLNADIGLAQRVIDRDEEVDDEEVKVESEVIRLLALYQPVGSDLRMLCTTLKVNNDLERIADCAVNIAKRTTHVDPAVINDHADELRDMGTLVRHMLRRAVQAYGAGDGQAASNVPNEDETVDNIYVQVIQHVVDDAAGAAEDLASHLDLLAIAKNLERIADHATNIAEDVIFLSTGEIVRHQN